MGHDVPYVGSLEFKLSDFNKKDLIEKLHANSASFTTLKDLIKDNLKENMTNLKYENVTYVQNVLKYMPTIFNGIEFYIELIKVYLA